MDFDQLRDVADDEPDAMRRLVDLYLLHAGPLLEELDVALRASAGEDVARLAHQLIGSSTSCGVQAFTLPLRQLERLGRAGDLTGGDACLAQVRSQFRHVQDAFDRFLESTSAPACERPTPLVPALNR